MIDRPSLLDTPNLINWKEFTPSDIPGSSVDDCYANDSTIRTNYDGTDTAEWNTGKQIQETLPAAEWDAWMHDLNAYGWQVTELLNSIYDELYSVINGQQAGMSHELLDAIGVNAQTLTNKTISFDDNTLTNVCSLDTSQTLTNKTISFDDNTLQNVASLNTSQTLTNKTIDNKNNIFLSTPYYMRDTQTFTVTGECTIVIDSLSTDFSTYIISDPPSGSLGFPLTIIASVTKDIQFKSFTDGQTTVTKTITPGVHHLYAWTVGGWTYIEISGTYTDNTAFTYLI